MRRLLPILLLASGCQGSTARLDAGASGDAGGKADAGTSVVRCGNGTSQVAPGTCSYAPPTRTSSAILVRADLITPDGLLEDGQLLVGGDGRIVCAACDCGSHAEAASAGVLSCSKAVVSPGLINAHDHITYTDAPPQLHPGEIYEHRNEWRKGLDGHHAIPSIPNMGAEKGIWWGELRGIMAGSTSVNGSGGYKGLMRNLDTIGDPQEGLNQPRVRYQTFPLGDVDGTLHDSGCMYPSIDTPNDAYIQEAIAYTPHVAEGIGLNARNEFLCLSSMMNGGEDVMFQKTGIIHGVGLLAQDLGLMAQVGVSLIWSPRSNISLYGDTARVTTAANMGVNVALGADWTESGSINMIRELACASQFNDANLGGFFSDRDLVDMATVNSARALKSDSKIGVLAQGRFADVAVWSEVQHPGYRAIIDASPSDVILVLRAGLPLYGDLALMSALAGTSTTGCEAMDVCGTMKSICSVRETQLSVAQIKAQIAPDAYDLFFCGTPANEPTCVPSRSIPTAYAGVPSMGDKDGDGIPDAMDDCPTIFNPVRPLDGTTQADGDGDMFGDACDPCPLDPSSSCVPPPTWTHP
jgi:hypothetical protein